MTLRIRCRGVWPGLGGEVWGAHELMLSGERIASIAPIATADTEGYLMPSFVDAHWHLSWAGLEASRLVLDEVRSRDELLGAVRVAAAVGAGVLHAEKFDESTWSDPRLPTLAELDAVTGPRPAFVRRVCGHLALVNRALLELLPVEVAGAARETGVLRERAVLDFDRIVPPSSEQLHAAFEAAAERALREGVTAVCTMEPLVVARELRSAALRIDVRCAAFADDWELLEEVVRAPGPRSGARLFGAKLFLDGAIGARTAALGCGYADGSRPPLLYEDAVLRERLVAAWELGLTPVAHAIGARAIEQVARVSLDAARRTPRSRGLGVRIEHAEELGGVPERLWDSALHRICMQPNFVRRWQQPAGLYEQRLPTGAAAGLNPFAAVGRRGLRLGFGSDGMPFGPRWGIAGATSHPAAVERLSRAQALHAYGLGAAAISDFPELARPIEPGRRADLVVLSADPLSVPDLAEARVLAVYARGELAWSDEQWRG